MKAFSTALLCTNNYHSLTHWTAWPAMGRCALQTSRSPAMSQAASAASPTSISSWRIQVCRGRSRGRFHAGLSSGWWPARELTTRRSVRVQVLILADDVHERILRLACLGFCCGCFVAGSGSLLTRLVQSRTSVFQKSVVSKKSGRIRASVRLTLLGSKFLHNTVGRRQQGHCTVAAWCAVDY